jgi:hypothetical protein
MRITNVKEKQRAVLSSTPKRSSDWSRPSGKRSAINGWKKTRTRWMNTTAASKRAARSAMACGGFESN